jgi:ankyrin repeat protein
MLGVRGLKSLAFAANMLIAGGEHGTALQIALDLQNLDIIELLVEHGADPNVQGASFPILEISSRHVDGRRQVRDGPPSSIVQKKNGTCQAAS